MMKGFNTCYEVASWLNADGNANGENASDLEFAEVFGLLDFLRNGRRIPLMYDADAMILNMDVNGLCEHLKAVLGEIQCMVVHRIGEE